MFETFDSLPCYSDFRRKNYLTQSCRRSKPLAQILLLDQGRSIKPKLDTGVEVYNNKVKKKQRHITNEKPNIYINIFNKKNQYFDS